MKKFYYIALVLLLGLAPLDMAHAKGGNDGWMIGLDLNQQSSKSETTVGSSTSSGAEVSSTQYDFSVGYVMSSGLYVGGLYTGSSVKLGDVSSSGSGMGASVGYIFGPGFHLTGSYILSATDGDVKKGSGMQVDFGWRTMISSSFFVGAKLSYKNLKYTEVSGADSVAYTTTQPYVSLGFSF